MIGREFPIVFMPPTTTSSSSGGTFEAYDVSDEISDFAEVSDLNDNKNSSLSGQGTVRGKRFKVDYRPSLAITTKWLIRFDGVEYTIQSIGKERNKKFQYVIEGRAKV